MEPRYAAQRVLLWSEQAQTGYHADMPCGSPFATFVEISNKERHAVVSRITVERHVPCERSGVRNRRACGLLDREILYP